jgi:hypothetical protein
MHQATGMYTAPRKNSLRQDCQPILTKDRLCYGHAVQSYLAFFRL